MTRTGGSECHECTTKHVHGTQGGGRVSWLGLNAKKMLLSSGWRVRSTATWGAKGRGELVGPGGGG